MQFSSLNGYLQIIYIAWITISAIVFCQSIANIVPGVSFRSSFEKANRTCDCSGKLFLIRYARGVLLGEQLFG